MKIVYLTRKELLEIHTKVVKETNSRDDNFPVIFEGNLDYCVEAPQEEFFGEEIHKTIHEKAATIICKIDKLHPFLDGNKRTGFAACDVFLRMNGFMMKVERGTAIETSLKIAQCLMDIDETSDFIKNNSRANNAAEFE